MRSMTAGAVKDPPEPSSTMISQQPTSTKESEKVEQPQLPKKISRGVSTDQKKVEESKRSTEDPSSNKENISRPCSRASKGSTKTFTVDDESSHKGEDRVKMCKCCFVKSE